MKRFSTFLVLISFFWQTVAYAALPAKFDGIRSSADVEVTGSISVGAGGAPDSKAVLDLKSTTKGMLPPRMTTAQRNAIASPPTGLMVYDTDTLTVWQYNGAGWIEVGSGGTAGAQYNVIENFGFEATTYNEDWTASGGTLAAAAGSNILFGDQSATWDASASTQTFSYASLAIGQGYKSNNCEGAIFVQTPSGTASHTLQVYDGTNVLASVSITSYTTPKEFSTGAFPCPSSGNWQLRLVANADEPLIAIDNAYLGLARNVGVADFIGERIAYSPTFNSTTGHSASNGWYYKFGGYAVVGGSILFNGTGAASTFTFSMPPGLVIDTSRLNSSTVADLRNRVGSWSWYDDSGGLSINPQWVKPSTDTTLLFVDGSNSVVSNSFANNDRVSWEIVVPIVGWSASQVVQPNQQRAPKVTRYTSGSGTHTWSNGVTYAEIEMVGGGGGGAGSGTASGGSGGAGGNTTFAGLLTANGGAGGVVGTGLSSGGAVTVSSPAVQLMAIAGANGGGTQYNNLADGNSGGAGASSCRGGAGGQASYSSPGFSAKANSGSGGGGAAANAAVGGSYTGQGGAAGGCVRAQIIAPSGTAAYAVGAAGSAGSAGTNGYAGGAGGAGEIVVTEYFGYTTAILANSVTTKRQSGDRILSGTFNCDASSTVTRTNEPDSTSIGNIASGACAVTYAPFSAAPDACTPVIQTCSAPSGTGCFARVSAAATASGVSVRCYSDTGADCTAHDFYMICTGPR
jgi:hypothetical protein